ncbi:methyltransferase [Formosa agariphila KMM 3901]|uniref:Methyltransferase n=1 Tax=Formosa agariphila (strain DSM 15362 / KCTC 12365 / LMG 23005 / KMM 3901 / M-2Alg 35-1) TaxID=1347342 RepID=T2KJF7_FORAG|nr:class I SAM-dependent methyltransferase [Formosa agariphila]CDF78905.1 methyltransferase [Formosa agariphila KMM 3901]
MNPEHDYKAINKATWNIKTETHLASDFYDVEGFINGNSSLNTIELELLGDVQGKKILHLQCHFGQDSLSLARLGAQVTGVDLSDVAIKNANSLTKQLELDASFICCDLYDLPNYLDDTFDIVYTSYGTIGWLPDLDQWAQSISKYLKPKGAFVFVEFHPAVWMFDDDFDKIIYSYFKKEAIVEIESGTYADRTANITQQSITWNHSLGEVLGSLLQNNLQLQTFKEFDYSPYDCFRNTVEVNPRQYRIKHLDSKIPMVYALKAIKD